MCVGSTETEVVDASISFSAGPRDQFFGYLNRLDTVLKSVGKHELAFMFHSSTGISSLAFWKPQFGRTKPLSSIIAVLITDITPLAPSV